MVALVGYRIGRVVQIIVCSRGSLHRKFLDAFARVMNSAFPCLPSRIDAFFPAAEAARVDPALLASVPHHVQLVYLHSLLRQPASLVNLDLVTRYVKVQQSPVD